MSAAARLSLAPRVTIFGSERPARMGAHKHETPTGAQCAAFSVRHGAGCRRWAARDSVRCACEGAHLAHGTEQAADVRQRRAYCQPQYCAWPLAGSNSAGCWSLPVASPKVLLSRRQFQSKLNYLDARTVRARNTTPTNTQNGKMGQWKRAKTNWFYVKQPPACGPLPPQLTRPSCLLAGATLLAAR